MEERVIANRYILQEKVGVGGMAVVYKAHDQVLERTVAVKMMLPQYASDSTFAQRFRQEAQSAAALQSPYIVNIFDWGLDGETYYIVMEYVRGVDLKTAIEQRGSINQRKVAQIGAQVCSGLAAAHEAGIIHRDIKSQNIMVQVNGDAKVMDFGIAHGVGNAHMTQTGSVLGTAQYVSPEQAQGFELTPASDIYSLGIVLYEAVTGKLPFDGTEAVAVALKQVNTLPEAPSTLCPDIDPRLEAIILKALAKNPAERFSCADEMRLALNDFLNGRQLNFAPATATAVLPAGGAAFAGADPTSVLGTVQGDAGMQGAYGVSGTAVIPSSASKGATGGALADQVQPYESPAKRKAAAEKAKKKKTGRIIAIIIVVLAVLAGAAIGLLGTFEQVPSLVGMTQTEADMALSEHNLAIGETTEVYSDTYAKGVICDQTPKAHKRVRRNTTVDVVISMGLEPGDIEVPDLTKMTEAEALKTLQALKLVGVKRDDVDSNEFKEGIVCWQSPEHGQMVKEGTEIKYDVSTGGAEVEVPKVVGMSRDDAADTLKEAGFRCTYSSQHSNSVPVGVIISQNPKNGTTCKTSTIIELVVSNGPEEAVVPSVIGETENSAMGLIQDRGFDNITAVYSKGDTYGPESDGIVIDCSPGGGSKIGLHDPIVITVFIYVES